MGNEFFTRQLLLVLLVVHHVAVRLQHHPDQQQTRVNIQVWSIFEACRFQLLVEFGLFSFAQLAARNRL